MPCAAERKAVGRIIKIGNGFYMGIPLTIIVAAGLKKGDRVAMDCDGRMIYAARIPFEELIRRRVPKQSDLVSEQVSEVS